MTGLGKRVLLLLHLWSFPPRSPGVAKPWKPTRLLTQRPPWRHTSWPLHIHQREGFWIGGENVNLSLFLLFSLPFHVFHSYALTEGVYHSGFTCAVTPRVHCWCLRREGQGTSHYVQVLAGLDRPQGGHAVPSERALSVRPLTLKWSPAKGYAKDTQHHYTGLWEKILSHRSSPRTAPK